MSQVAFWDRLAPAYERFIGRTLGRSYRRLAAELPSDLAAGDRVLEVGAGTGLLARPLADRVACFVATDLSLPMLRVAQHHAEREARPLRLAAASAERLPFPAASFDVVLASNLLHLLDVPERALDEIGRVLMPGGRAILPTYCHGESRSTRMLSRLMSLSGFRAVHRWSSGEYDEWLEAQGWRLRKFLLIPDRMPLAYCVVVRGAATAGPPSFR